MPYFDWIDVSEGIDANKTSASKDCDICHYWYSLNFIFKFQSNFCNRCHDLLMMSMNLTDIAIFNIPGCDYRYIISLISKNESINVMQNADLFEKWSHKHNVKCWFIRKKLNIIKHLLSYIKMGKEILTLEDIEIEKNKF